jgi:predicted glycoside hydrolase/deacetylase ChbG (UPF0249 family)
MDALRKIVLCGDDYGLAPGVSRGIRKLLAQRRLTATSCMTVYPEFSEEGPLLRPFFEATDIGLHFTLTSDRPLSAVLISGWLRQLDASAVRRELDRQMSVFMSVMGRPPSYIDGHQHVHLLPHVRGAVVDVARKVGAYVRVTREPIDRAMFARPAAVDSAYLSWSARPLARLAARAGIRTNTGYRGTRSFREQEPYRDSFQRMIAGARSATIVCCHPGFVDDILIARDPIHAAREAEYAYLAGDEFPHDLSGVGLRLATLREALAY